MNFRFLQVDLNNDKHCKKLILLLDAYMQDEMGIGAPMPDVLAKEILDGLKNYQGYLGFFALFGNEHAALANCNKNFSTFKAKPLINIHDFIVHPKFRRKGLGRFLLDSIADYGKENGYCRINLEVRSDNIKARELYKKAGYDDCKPPMFFLEKEL